MDDRAATLTRLRWRLRGAWLWPAFFALTVLDALLLRWLPIAGDDGTGFIPGLLLAGLLNLLAVAVVAPLVGRRVRRRRPDLPKVVADDYAGAVLVVLVTAGLLLGGLAHRPALLDARHDAAVQRIAATGYAARFAPPEFRRNAAYTTSLKLEDELFRTCVPGDDVKRWFCVYVDTSSTPPGVTRDDNRQSNASLNAPGGFR